MEIESVVIGTGLSSIGYKLAKSRKSDDDNTLYISDPRSCLQKYKNNQILRFVGKWGTSEYWHGVIPLLNTDTMVFLNKFYKYHCYQMFNLRMFVPLRPLRSKSFFKENDRRIDGIVNSINFEGDLIKLKFISNSCKQEIVCKKLFIAAGVLGTLKIMKNSNLISNDCVKIGDHVCGFIGYISKDNLERVLKEEFKIVRSLSGYSVPYICGDDKKTMFTFRPARYEMLRSENQLRGGPKYSKGKLYLILDMMRKLALGRLFELISLRFGFFFKAKTYSIHFQHEVLNAHCVDLKNESITSIYSNDQVASEVFASARKIFNFTEVLNCNFYHGTHLFGADCESIEIKNLYFLDSTFVDRIYGEHHSFAQIKKSYEIGLL